MNMGPMRRKSLDELIAQGEASVARDVEKEKRADRRRTAFIVIAALLVAWTLLAGICWLLGLFLFGDRWLEPTILAMIGVTVMAIVAGVKLVCRSLRGGDANQSDDR